MQDSVTKDVLNRLKTVKGHVAGIEKMIEEGQNCTDILMQLGAIRSSINKVSNIIAEHYTLECYDKSLVEGGDPREVLKRAIQAMIKSVG
ncbi:MAG TPA: metal-sensitive transcriptional regulator [Desulfobacteria bacterium]|nr:metal-sensitive transcriptional regulator [Desulfobacteria bacterium]